MEDNGDLEKIRNSNELLKGKKADLEEKEDEKEDTIEFEEGVHVENRLSSNWSLTEIDYGNHSFDIPNATDWVRLRILNSDSIETTNSYSIHPGIISIDLFSQLSVGRRDALDNADTLGNIFNQSQFGNITTSAYSIVELGKQGSWYVINIYIPFYSEW